MTRADPAHQHAEAFCLMTYRADDGSEEEVIWNSRDGVTPFSITLRSGKPARHVDWHLDAYVPDYRPPLGSRIFVDLTRQRAEQNARDNAERFWDDLRYPAREHYESKEQLAALLASHYTNSGGEPDLIVVAG